MAKDYHDITRSVSTSLRAWRHDQPALIDGFNGLSDAALADGALGKKTKELIALALGVAAHCDACLGFHARALVRLGATRVEVEDALGVAVYMGGGPSLMYAADALSAFEQFASARESAPPAPASRPTVVGA
jgi:AhpD family alkylhydroperoxidase